MALTQASSTMTTTPRAFELRTTLRPWQEPAVEQLLPLRAGALYMEMGLGKTRTAMELAYRRLKKLNNIIWVCPVSIKHTIRYEWLKHTTLNPSDVYVFDEKTREGHIPQATVYIVGIESLSASARVVLALNSLITERSMVVMDESTLIKNHRAKRSMRLTQMAERARYRLVLTGTPFTQGIVDLFGQMTFLSDKILGYRSFWSFANYHLVYSDVHKGMIVGTKDSAKLAAKIAPYVYQVDKKSVIDLPPKLYRRHIFPLTEEQRDAYDMAKEDFFAEVDRDGFSSTMFFRLFGRLEQIACGFEKTKHGHRALKHKRLEALQQVLQDIPSNEQVIIWAKYHWSIEEIRSILPVEQLALLHGKISQREREHQIHQWRNGKRYLLATPQTASRGFTFNEASQVVIYASTSSYEQRKQLEDRCHRDGQTKTVTYTDIVAERTVDERIAEIVETKGFLLMGFRRKLATFNGKRRKDIRSLLEEFLDGEAVS